MSDNKVFSTMQFVEPALEPGQRYTGPQETLLGTFEFEADAVTVGRSAWLEFRQRDSADVAWWVVRASDEDLARWIADSRTGVERVLDLTTNELVEYRP